MSEPADPDHDQGRTGARGQEAGFDYLAYLQAKQSVDDAALNPEVYAAFEARLAAAQVSGGAPRLVEFGAGIGTMLLRLIRRGALHHGSYLLVDADEGSAQRAIAWIERAITELGFTFEAAGSAKGRITGRDLQVEVQAVEAEAQAWLGQAHDFAFEFALAHTFMDLVEPGAFLSALEGALGPVAHLWLTSTFAGHTAMAPAHPDDTELWAAYHGSMRARGGPRHAHALRAAIDASDLQLLAQGHGDWHVEVGSASADQRAFVGFILDTVEREPAVAQALGRQRLAGWLATRRTQLAASQLGFEAHQVDFLCAAPSP